MSTRRWRTGFLVLGVAIAAIASGKSGKSSGAYRPAIDPANFQATVDHPYLPLIPGTTCTYVEKEGKHTSEDQITVTSDTRVIMGVTCIVVHDVVRVDGAVKEDTYDWYAQDKQGNVWYFGEATKETMPGGKVKTEGSWEAGVGRGQPGIIMPASPTPGSAAYRQEYDPGNAEDMGQIAAVNETVTVPYGTLTGCVRTKEWSLLESGTDKKWYAKGIGFVREEAADHGVVALVAVKRP